MRKIPNQRNQSRYDEGRYNGLRDENDYTSHRDSRNHYNQYNDVYSDNERRYNSMNDASWSYDNNGRERRDHVSQYRDEPWRNSGTGRNNLYGQDYSNRDGSRYNWESANNSYDNDRRDTYRRDRGLNHDLYNNPPYDEGNYGYNSEYDHNRFSQSRNQGNLNYAPFRSEGYNANNRNAHQIQGAYSDQRDPYPPYIWGEGHSGESERRYQVSQNSNYGRPYNQYEEGYRNNYNERAPREWQNHNSYTGQEQPYRDARNYANERYNSYGDGLSHNPYSGNPGDRTTRDDQRYQGTVYNEGNRQPWPADQESHRIGFVGNNNPYGRQDNVNSGRNYESNQWKDNYNSRENTEWNRNDTLNTNNRTSGNNNLYNERTNEDNKHSDDDQSRKKASGLDSGNELVTGKNNTYTGDKEESDLNWAKTNTQNPDLKDDQANKGYRAETTDNNKIVSKDENTTSDDKNKNKPAKK